MGMSERSNAEMSLLEVITIFIFNYLFELFNLLSLIWTKRLHIDLFENFFLDIVDISAHRGLVNFGLLAS